MCGIDRAPLQKKQLPTNIRLLEIATVLESNLLNDPVVMFRSAAEEALIVLESSLLNFAISNE